MLTSKDKYTLISSLRLLVSDDGKLISDKASAKFEFIKSIMNESYYSLDEFHDELENLQQDITLQLQDEYDAKRSQYEAAKERKEIRGEGFKHTIKTGMLVKMEGTKDGVGLRQVLSVDAKVLTCRKLQKIRIWDIATESFGPVKYKLMNQITTHKWSKVKEILANSLEEANKG